MTSTIISTVTTTQPSVHHYFTTTQWRSQNFLTEGAWRVVGVSRSQEFVWGGVRSEAPKEPSSRGRRIEGAASSPAD